LTPKKALMRRLLIPLLLGVLAVSLAGCGASDSVTKSLDPVAAAATNTARLPTTHMSMTATMTVPGLPTAVQMSGEGAVDNVRKRGSMTMDMSSMAKAMPATGGLNDPSLWRGEYVFDFSKGMVAYMRFPFMTRALGSGKSWVRLDFGAVSREMGVNLDQFMQMNQSNPAQQLQLLRAVSGRFTKLGPGRVRGVTTTRYRTNVDIRKYPDLLPEQQRKSMQNSIDKLVDMMGGKSTYPVEVWIDAKQLVRRMSLRMDLEAPTGSMSMAMSMDFYGFGRPVSVRFPRADDTVDMTKLMQQAPQQ
jgi:hypothetical protein